MVPVLLLLAYLRGLSLFQSQSNTILQQRSKGEACLFGKVYLHKVSLTNTVKGVDVTWLNLTLRAQGDL